METPATGMWGDVELSVLLRLKEGWVTATWHVHQTLKSDMHYYHTMQQVRRLLRKMATAGLVNPVPYKSKRNYHWQITDSGRAVIALAGKR